MKRHLSLILFGLALLVLGSCSRKKDTFVTRNFHAVTAEFNALYNGGEAFIDGNEELATTYRDNFWEVLPVERFEIKEAIIKPGEKGNPNFNRAEDKAAKAIQKHSIYLNGKEYNPQIDEAYMLLGKARYFGQRFIPAIDAFNFILNRYPSSNSINEARMWKAKCNIQLGNEEIAIKELVELFGKEGLTDQDKADAAAIMAQAYINLDTLPAALPMIQMAASMIKDKELQGRYRFIEGQIQSRLEQPDSANLAFQKVIDLKRNTSRSYYVRSFLEQVKNFNFASGDTVALKQLLWDLGQDRENRPFRDAIFHQTGNVYRIMNNIDTAVAYYNKSIEFYNEDRQLQATNYSTLADINFDLAEYQKAGKYYDSTLTFLEENSRTWRRMKKRRENLADVIKYERIATVNDSILSLVAMSPEEQLAYFKAYTEKLVAAAKEDSIAAAKREKKAQNNEFYTKKASKNTSGATFYFYNSTTVAYGKQEFRSIWGKRGLEDNWRNATKGTITPGADEIAAEEEGVPIERRTIMDPNTYIGRIPSDSLVIDSLKRTRNFAYYQLGLVYKEKFREYRRAVDKLEKLLTYQPQERLILPSKYYLYKIYEVLNDKQAAESWKMDIINNHPESRYAEILRNPRAQLANGASSPEFKYKALYKLFEEGDYQQVLRLCDEYINLYTGNDILPKFELLKATALMYVEGFESYKNAVNFVALTYPQSDEGKQAQDIYGRVLPSMSSTEFKAQGDQYKIVYRFDRAQVQEAELYLETTKAALANFPKEQLQASQDYYSPQEQFVVIHGLKSPLGAKGFAETLAADQSYGVDRPYFVISSENYRVVQWHKNLIDYLDLQSVEANPSGQ